MAVASDRFSPARIDALRVPPHSIDAEQAVLGGLMLDDKAWERIADKLVEDDFYRKDHRLIFRAIGDLANKNMPCDAVTLADWFDSNKLSDLVGGSSYVIQLANSTPSAANIVAYAEIVRDKSTLRQLIEAGTEIAGDGFQPEGRSTQEILEGAEQKVFAIAEGQARGRKGFTPMRTAVKEAFQILHQRYESKGAVTGLAKGQAVPDAGGRDRRMATRARAARGHDRLPDPRRPGPGRPGVRRRGRNRVHRARERCRTSRVPCPSGRRVRQ